MGIVKTGIVKGYIIDAWSGTPYKWNGKRTEKVFHYQIIEHDKAKEPYSSKFSIEILDGVTGYESFYLDKYSMPHYTDPTHGYYNLDWCACAGTYRKYHQLWIYDADMKEALKEYIELWKKEPWEVV